MAELEELREALHAMKLISRLEKQRIAKLEWMLWEATSQLGNEWCTTPPTQAEYLLDLEREYNERTE